MATTEPLPRPQAEGSIDDRSVLQDDYPASIRAASRGSDFQQGVVSVAALRNDPKSHRSSRTSFDSDPDDYSASDMASKPSNATPLTRQPSSPFGLLKATIRGKQQEANVKKVKQAPEPRDTQQRGKQKPNPPLATARGTTDSRQPEASVNAVRSMFIDSPSKQIKQLDSSTAIAKALQNWESQYSNWEGLTTYYLRRFAENTEEVGPSTVKELKEQMARQMTALSTAGLNLSKAVVELQQLYTVEEKEIRSQSSKIRDEQERNAKVHKDLEQALGQELVNAKKTELVIAGLRKQVQDGDLDISVLRKEIDVFKRTRHEDRICLERAHAHIEAIQAQETEIRRHLSDRLTSANSEIRRMTQEIKNQDNEIKQGKKSETELKNEHAAKMNRLEEDLMGLMSSNIAMTEARAAEEIHAFKEELEKARSEAVSSKEIASELREIARNDKQQLQKALKDSDSKLKKEMELCRDLNRKIGLTLENLDYCWSRERELATELEFIKSDKESQLELLARGSSFMVGTTRLLPLPLLSKEVRIFEAIQYPTLPEGWSFIWIEDRRNYSYVNSITKQIQETLPTLPATQTLSNIPAEEAKNISRAIENI